MQASKRYTLVLGNPHYSSWSLRPWLLMSHLGMDFDVRWFNFGPPFSTLAFHEMAPAGQVPVLHANGQIIWDSLAIAEYLAEQHPGVWPIDPIARAWARSASAEMHANFSSLRNLCPFAVALRAHHHQQDMRLQGELERLQTIWQEGLAGLAAPSWPGSASARSMPFTPPWCFACKPTD